MADHTTQVTVERSRIDRLKELLSLVADGALDHERCSIPIDHKDDFAMLEQALNLFTQELGGARTENELHVRELTESRQELESRVATIQAQQIAIDRLSNPILEIWDGVLVLPVIGFIDTQRAADMTEHLLRRVVATGSQSVIVDVTGAAAFDTATADHFLRLLRAARLLGAECVLTGISPENAQALIGLEIDFRDVVTQSSLKEALKWCMDRRRATRAAKPSEPNRPSPPESQRPLSRRAGPG